MEYECPPQAIIRRESYEARWPVIMVRVPTFSCFPPFKPTMAPRPCMTKDSQVFVVILRLLIHRTCVCDRQHMCHCK